MPGNISALFRKSQFAEVTELLEEISNASIELQDYFVQHEDAENSEERSAAKESADELIHELLENAQALREKYYG